MAANHHADHVHGGDQDGSARGKGGGSTSGGSRQISICLYGIFASQMSLSCHAPSQGGPATCGP